MNKIVKIQKIGVVSAAKIYGIILAVMGFFIGVFLGIVSLISGLFGSSMIGGGIGGAIGSLAFILVPFMYGAIGFVLGGVMTLRYNLIAKKLGGLEVVVDD